MTDATDAPYGGGLVVRPGDTLVLVVDDADGATADTLDALAYGVRSKLPEGADVLLLVGVTPVVIQGQGRCEATARAGFPDRDWQCQRPRGHQGPHDAHWPTGGVSW